MPESCPSSFVDQMQGAALVGGDVIGLVALDLVLRFLRRSTATVALVVEVDRKSTRLNSSHVAISYAVFCLKKIKKASVFAAACSPQSCAYKAMPPIAV